jgi:diguanylate cyclase (GGDEF)-like protein
MPPRIRRISAVSALSIAGIFAFGLLPVAREALAEPAKNAPEQLRTITTAREAHDLTSEEAKRAYPIHLRGVVTYFDTDTGSGFGAIYVQDSSGSIFVKTPGGAIKSLPIGSVIDLWGVSDPGGFAPVVDRAVFKIVGHAPLPPGAVPVSRTQLFAGEYEGQWVEVDGIVHSVSDSGHIVTVELGMADGILYVTSVREAGANYSGLIDARVRVHGHEAPLYNARGQMIGARIVFPNLTAIKVIEAPPPDPFHLPTILIDNLFRWDAMSAMRHRVHLRGKVTMQWPGASLCIRDASGGICSQTAQTTPVAAGDVVDVVGFAGAENSTAVLANAVFWRADNGAPVSPEFVSADQALAGKHNSQLVQIEGQLIGRDLASADTTLMLNSGNFIFTAVLPKNLAGQETDAWKNGSILRVTGVCSVEFDPRLSVLADGMAVPKSFRVLMRSPGDVVVVQKPSWWTPAHALLLLAFAFAATLGVLAWVAALRRRVQRQADLLRESEERFRHMALHDALTGLATRLLLQDRMDAAVLTAKRHQAGLALLVVDLDRFKDVNDTFGHPAGDEVLRVTADRLLEAVRKSDTVARIGGDEFVVLLADLHDLHVAERIASSIVKALAAPVLFEGVEMLVSVSVGVCTASAGELDAEALFRGADAALYQAKASGRNRFWIFTPEMAGAQTRSPDRWKAETG